MAMRLSLDLICCQNLICQVYHAVVKCSLACFSMPHAVIFILRSIHMVLPRQCPALNR
jgi:hypothetical protein